uniref:Uncharacterized protein n=1 Tax=Anopheles merus TaxID=30066 RepID=A0A182VA34_ANOME
MWSPMLDRFSALRQIWLISGLLWFIRCMYSCLYSAISLFFSSILRISTSFSFSSVFTFSSTSRDRTFAFSRDFRTAMLFRSRRLRYSSVPLSTTFCCVLRPTCGSILLCLLGVVPPPPDAPSAPGTPLGVAAPPPPPPAPGSPGYPLMVPINWAPPEAPFASSCRRYSFGSTGSSLMLAESADEPTELFSSLEVLPYAAPPGLLELERLGGGRLHERVRHRTVGAADRHHLGEDAERFRVAELVVDQVLQVERDLLGRELVQLGLGHSSDFLAPHSLPSQPRDR